MPALDRTHSCTFKSTHEFAFRPTFKPALDCAHDCTYELAHGGTLRPALDGTHD
jgi:hypothetical protein